MNVLTLRHFCRILRGVWEVVRHLWWLKWLQYLSFTCEWVPPLVIYFHTSAGTIIHDGDLSLKNVNRHHLIHNIHHCSLRTQTYFRLSLEPVTAGNTSTFAGYHHWGIAKSLESCRHIIHWALPFPCCPFGIVGKRRYLIAFYESVKCEKIL